MDKRTERRPRRNLLPSAPDMRDLDTVDTCRMRLLALRTRVEGNWPTGGRFLNRGGGLARDSEMMIEDLLVALPTPLPLVPGGDPETIFCQDDTDLRAVAGRAVDAGLALLDGSNLGATYAGQVSMLESHRPGALQPIVVSDPTVGLLVATIIGTLEAISERIGQSGTKAAVAKAADPQPDGSSEARWVPPKRGRVVPRI
jgi:hypothetical protein